MLKRLAVLVGQQAHVSICETRQNSSNCGHTFWASAKVQILRIGCDGIKVVMNTSITSKSTGKRRDGQPPHANANLGNRKHLKSCAYPVTYYDILVVVFWTLQKVKCQPKVRLQVTCKSRSELESAWSRVLTREALLADIT